MALKVPDFRDPRTQRAAVRNLVSLYHATPEDVRQAATPWYQHAHELAERDRGKLSHKTASGLLAVTSAGSDWESRNSSALSDLRFIGRRGIDEVLRNWKGRRNVLGGSSLMNNNRAQLTRASRLLHGEDPESVMSRFSAPKTNQFMNTIHNPEDEGAVIDRRERDIMINKMMPWRKEGSYRGISTRSKRPGKENNYDAAERAMQTAAQVVSQERGERVRPHEVQSVTWVEAKRRETAGKTQAGTARTRGVPRKGQPYL